MDRAIVVIPVVEIEGVRRSLCHKVRSILRRVRVTVSRKRTVRRNMEVMEQRMSSVSAEEMPRKGAYGVSGFVFMRMTMMPWPSESHSECHPVAYPCLAFRITQCVPSTAYVPR